MKLLLSNTKESIHLEAEPFAKGGEGALYRVLRPTKYQDFVAKIYHPTKRTKQREYKLKYLLKNPPVFENPEQRNLVSWPVDLLEEKHQVIGFLMREVYGEPLEVLATFKLPKYLPKTWKRFELGERNALTLRQKVCFNIAVAIYHLHKTGKYVLVDLKPENILIQENGLVSIVDIDSIEVSTKGQLLFPAAMTTPEYAPPEFYKKEGRSKTISSDWDTFSMAIIFYKILLGIHPFAATSKESHVQATSLGAKIKAGLYVHNKNKEKYLEQIPVPHQAFEKHLAKPIQYLFNICFSEGVEDSIQRPTAEEWCIALGGDELRTKKERDIFVLPKTHFDISLGKDKVVAIFKENEFGLVLKKWLEDKENTLEKLLKKRKRKDRLNFWRKIFDRNIKKEEKWTYKDFEIELCLRKDLHEVLNDLVGEFECQYSAYLLRYNEIVRQYYKEKKIWEVDWSKYVRFIKEQLRELNCSRRKQIIEITNEKKEQALWKQFWGATLKQKQKFLNSKYLPHQLETYKKERDKSIQKIDETNELIWRKLEKEHYEKLSKINKASINGKLKIEAKKKEELRFVKERQLIIESIQSEKKAANNKFFHQKKLIKSSINNYSRQLEAIEAEALNKVFLLEERCGMKFEKMYLKMVEKKASLIQDKKNIEYRVELSLKELEESYSKSLGESICKL